MAAAMHHGDVHGHFRQAPFDWQRLVREQESRLPLADAWWDLLGRPVGRRVADIGCGPGILAHRYAQLGAEVIAVDLREDALALVPPHPRLRTLRHDIEAGPLPRQVDIAIMTDMLHHAADPEALLRNARSSAKEVLVAEPGAEAKVGLPDQSRIPSDRLAAWLASAGFEPGPVRWPRPDHYAIHAKARSSG